MKTLFPRATKGIDQEAMSGAYPYQSSYVALENMRHWTGLGVSPELALNLITVYQCVRVLSNLFAQLPLILYRRLPEGGKQRAIDHPYYDALHLRPNPDMSSFTWRRLMMVHLATWGNHYSEKTEDAMGRPQLWPIRPDRIEAKWESGRKAYYYLDPRGGRKLMREGSIFHVAGLSTDGLVGSSPIADLRSTITLAKTAENFGTSFLRNDARPGVVLTHPKALSKLAQDRLAVQMDDLRGSGNKGKTVILEEGLDFKEIGVPPEDAQLMATRLFQKRELAGAYGIPPHKIGDLERATFSNIEHQSLELIQDTMMPWFVNFEQEASIQLIEDDDVFSEFLVDGYLRGDAKTRAEAFAVRWQHGNLSPDEWREKENENPIPGGSGKLYYTPVNYSATNDEAPPKPAGIVDRRQPPVTSQPPQLVAVKSGSVRCPDCNRLLAEVATPPYRLTCSRCKTVTEAGQEAVA